jgi:hypothetical protein
MAKPTPPQARLLKQLADHPGGTAIERGEHAILTDADGRRDKYGEPTRIHWRRLMVCKRLGWIDLAHSKTQFSWHGGFVPLYVINDAGRAAIADLPPEAFVSKKHIGPSVQGEAARVLQALSDRFEWPEWVFLPEVSMRVPDPTPGWPERTRSHRLDALAISIYQSSGYARVGFEVKVSRSDFLHELATPEKTKASAYCCSKFYFAVPKGLIEPKDVPDPYGLIVVDPKGRTRIIKRPIPSSNPPTWAMVAYLIHRVMGETREVSRDRENHSRQVGYVRTRGADYLVRPQGTRARGALPRSDLDGHGDGCAAARAVPMPQM